MGDLGDATNDDLFALFEVVLSGSKIRHMKEAKPVVFALSDGDTWLFDPRREGPLFARGTLIDRSSGASPQPALVVGCSRKLLVRLVMDPEFKLADDDDVNVVGNIEDMLPMAHAVAEQSSALGIRLPKAK